MQPINASDNYKQASLNALAKQIRDLLQAIQDHESNALDRGLEVGSVLREARSRVPAGNWKHWLQTNCTLGVSTAFLYIQLAEHRSKIEAARAQRGHMSLRAARRLISGGQAKRKTNKPSLDLLSAWKMATLAERITALTHLGVEEFYAVYAAMPGNWREKMAARVTRLRGTGANDSKLTAIIQKAASLVKSANEPGTSEAVAASSNCEALAALRQLVVILATRGKGPVDLNVNDSAGNNQSSRRRAA